MYSFIPPTRAMHLYHYHLLTATTTEIENNLLKWIPTINLNIFWETMMFMVLFVIWSAGVQFCWRFLKNILHCFSIRCCLRCSEKLEKHLLLETETVTQIDPQHSLKILFSQRQIQIHTRGRQKEEDTGSRKRIQIWTHSCLNDSKEKCFYFFLSAWWMHY